MGRAILVTIILTAGLDIGGAVFDTMSGIGEFARLYGAKYDRSVVKCDLYHERCRVVARRTPDRRFVDRLLGALQPRDRPDVDAERCRSCGRAP